MSLRTHRLLLALLLLPLAAVQLRFTISTLAYVADPETRPELPFALNPATMALSDVSHFAEAAGLQKQDVLLAVEGVPVKTRPHALREVRRYRVGRTVHARVRRGAGEIKEIAFTLPPLSTQAREDRVLDAVISIYLNIVVAWLCITLGFLVAYRLPPGLMAYSFLLLLIGISQRQVSNGDVKLAWEPWLVWLGWWVQFVGGSLWVPGWLWFALSFPNPRSPYKLLPWTGWVLAVPYTIWTLAAAAVGQFLDYGGSGPTWLKAMGHIPEPFGVMLVVTFLSLGYANLLYKMYREPQPAARRRLQWILMGLTVGMMPIFLLFTRSALTRQDPDSLTRWLLIPAIVSPGLVPITLAYAVLVQRVVDVGMAIRQGLLATKTVSVIRAVLVGVLIWTAIQVEAHPEWPAARRMAAIGACVAAILAVRSGAVWLRRWVDRQFFQEAVNSEHVLAELSREVRQITDRERLLRTVSERVSGALHVPKVVALLRNGDGFVPAYAYGFDGGSPAVSLRPDDPVVARLRQDRQPMRVKREDSHTEGGQRLGAMESELLLPLAGNAGLEGIFSLGPKRSEEPYSGSDLRLLELVADQTALALENTRLAAVVAEEATRRERMESELAIAREVQHRLFPKRAPQMPGLEVAGRCVPAQSIGGDYYDFLVTPAGQLGLAIGDVAGKGVPAALLMAGLQASLRGLTLAGIDNLSELMAKLNRLVYDATPANRFATFFYGLYEPHTRCWRYSAAGHNPALLLRGATGETEWLRTRGVGLGMRAASAFEQAQVVLQPGDWLILYTDGITEARNGTEEEFGDERLRDAVLQSNSMSAVGMVDRIIEAATDFAAGAPQHDDLTVIAARAY